MNQVMVVDDEAPMRAALEAQFRRDGWDVLTAYGANDALTKFRQAPVPLVVTDMRMPDGDGLRVMRGLREMDPNVGVVFLTAFGSVPEAVKAMHEGACDYLVKPVCFEQLKDVAVRVMGRASGQTRQGVSASEEHENAFAGSSAKLRTVLQRARQAARTDMDVLVEAESGTGKELLARLIHQTSGRRNRGFVAVNCAAFPETLLESELFGHARGAFTGASVAKPGKFELADGGTLLLDEIGEMPLPLQPKLLRALQEREIDKLGETKPLRVDVRVVATTNRSLRALVEEGKFRADLFYRLNVVPISIPPLRERREDIAELAAHFVRKHASGAQAPQFSPEMLEQMRMLEWPGNVRELENFVRRAVALHPGERVGVEFLSETEMVVPAVRCESGVVADGTAVEAIPGTSLREMERKLLESTLESVGGNRTHAARKLGICPRTMRNKIREYGLPPRRCA